MPLLEKPPFLNMSDATAVDDCAAAAMDDLSKEKSAALVAKHQHEQLIRDALPQCQPQEGSPANTFTIEELQVLQAAMGISSSSSLLAAAAPDAQQQQSQHPPFSLPNSNQRNEEDAATATNSLAEKHQTISTGSNSSRIGLNIITAAAAATAPLGQRLIDIREPWGVEEVDSPEKIETCFSPLPLAAASSHQPHWIPRAIPTATTTAMARLFREAVRTGRHTAPTNGVCPGFLQCNLVVLPLDTVAFDFLLFCQRNSQACPLLEVCVDDDDNNDDGEEPRLLEDEKDGQRKRNTRKQYSYAPQRLAQGADLRTDISKYVRVVYF